jgi:hypothetical protein
MFMHVRRMFPAPYLYGSNTTWVHPNCGVNPKNETVKEDTLCRKGNCEWQRDGILNIFDRWQWSE